MPPPSRPLSWSSLPLHHPGFSAMLDPMHFPDRPRLLVPCVAGLWLCLGACELDPFGSPAPPPPPAPSVPCASTADCCAHSPSSLCSFSTGTCTPNAFCASDPACFGSRFGQCGASTPAPPAPDPTPPPTADTCPEFSVGAAPIGPPAFAVCGVPGSSTATFMADLNLFWRSSMVACACDSPDALQAGCQSNGMVLSATPGYIYYDRNLLAHLTASTGLGLSAAWFIAHEAGHNVQLALGIPASSGKQKELGADCLAGYFIAWLACEGRVPWSYTDAALQTACQIGDPFTSPWFAHQAHGTCAERQQAVSLGMRAYGNGNAPWLACAF
jgi:hypothetical protein